MNASRLRDLLQENVDSLHDMATLFDAGRKSVAKDMAVRLRVLFHDAGNSSKPSVSLLAQLGIKEAFNYVDTAQMVVSGNIFPSWGLVVARLSANADGTNEAVYEAPLDNLSPSRQKHSSFADWWNNTIIKDNRDHSLSRGQLIKLLANEEGGAHVDPAPNKKYTAMTKLNSLMGTAQFADEDPPQGLAGKPLEESTRQIVFEVLKTFEEQPEVFANIKN